MTAEMTIEMIGMIETTEMITEATTETITITTTTTHIATTTGTTRATTTGRIPHLIRRRTGKETEKESVRKIMKKTKTGVRTRTLYQLSPIRRAIKRVV